MAVRTTPRGHDGGNREVIESLNPATGEVLGTVPVDSEAEVDAAVDRAREAGEAWEAMGFARRHDELTAFRRAIALRSDELAQLIHLETGKPAVDAMGEVMLALSHVQHAASRAEKVLGPHRVPSGLMKNFRATVTRHPLGVIAVIGPWNYPLYTPMGSIAYALAAGNAVVFKPSELTPLVGKLLGEIAASSLSVPGLLQVVTGDGRTGAALAKAAVDKIAFTGSTATGKRVMMAAAERLTPVLLELGGKDPLIVAEDADIDKAAEAAVFGSLYNAGQACVSIERCYVASPIYDQFIDKVLQHADRVRWGNVDAPHIGAMTMPRQVELVRAHIEDAVAKGATVLRGGVDQIQGPFIPPTILANVTPEMRVMKEETFGPVLPIVRVANVDEAVDKANATRYGLGSAVFGKARVEEVAARIRAGATAINSVLSFTAIPALPFGGVGDSGFGRIHGDDGLREFTRSKATAEERFALPLSVLSFRLPANMLDRMRTMVKQLYGGGVVDRAGDALRRLL